MGNMFCMSYPREEAMHKVEDFRRGTAEQLEPFAILSQPIAKPVNGMVCLFQMTAAEKHAMEHLNFRVKEQSAPTPEQKYRRSIHHIIEMGCTISLLNHQ